MSLLSWKLARARLRRHAQRSLAVGIVVALALLSLLTLQGISHSSTNSLVTYSLSELPVGDRMITVSSNWVFTSAPEYQSASRYLATNLSGFIDGGLLPEVLYHELSDSHGIGFNFGGIDDLTKQVRLKSGRFPAMCKPGRCEVLQIGGDNRLAPRPDSLGLVVVGFGDFLNSQIFNGTFAPSPDVPVLVADGLAAASSLPSFASLQGAEGWVGAINLKSIERIGLNRYLDSLRAVENQVSIDHSELTVTWPNDALAEASSKTQDFIVRFVLLSYVVGALLVAFLILFSIRHKGEHFQFRSGLSRIGTPRKTLAEELFIEFAAPLIIGLGAAVVLSPLLPKVLSVMNFHAGLSQIYQGWQSDLLLLLVALAFAIGFVTLGDKAWGRLVLIPFAVGILLALLYFLTSGEHDLRAWEIPILCAILSVVACYLSLRWISSLWRSRNAQTYILMRENYGVWQGVGAILALTTLLAVVTLSFDSGIAHSVQMQAEDQVPLDVSIKTGPSLIRPLDVRGIADYGRLVTGSSVYPVLRVGSSVRSQGSIAVALPIIGVQPDALSKMSSPSLRGLVKTITPATPVFEPGVNLGSNARIEVQLAHIPKEVDLFAWFRTPRGMHSSSTFNGHGDHRTLLLGGQVPSASTLVAFEFRETSDYLSRRLHAMGEGSFSVPELRGVGSILRVTADGQPLLLDGRWNTMNFPYAFDGGSLFIRPTQSYSIPRVVVDPATANLASNGLLTLSEGSNAYFQVRVGAVRPYFPSVGSRFLVVDLGQLQQEISRNDPGAVDPIELWVSTKHPETYQRRLETSSYRNLLVRSRIDALARFRADPINVGLDHSYKATLLLGLVIAVLMHVTALPLLRKESADLLFQLEVAGAGPEIMRRALRRALRLVLLIGVSIGLVIGLAVSGFYVSKSTPFVLISLTLMSAAVLSEAIGYFLTRKFFQEVTMVAT